MSKNVLIQGATGTVGGEVTKQLLKEGKHKVFVAARDLDKAKKLFDKKVEYRKFDIENDSTFEAALQGIDKIFYMSPGMIDTSENAKKFFDLANEKGVDHIINMTAKGVNYSDNPLRRVELALENSGVDFTHVRPTWFSDNFNKFWRPWVNEGKFESSMQDGKLAFVDARDIAAVAVAAINDDKHKGGAYDVTGAEAIDNYEAVKILSEVSGREITYKPISEQAERKRLKEMGMPDSGVEYMLRIVGMVREGMAAETTNDVEKVLGTKPYTFRQYAEDKKHLIFDN